MWTIAPLSMPADLDAVLAIEEASFTNPWTRAMYVAELDNRDVSFCYVIRDDAGRVFGFCSFWRILDELHINNIAILAECRGVGAGTALLERVMRDGRALGARRVTLEVRRSNEPARRLYERLGFVVAGVRRAYYTNPEEDALVLWKEPPG